MLLQTERLVGRPLGADDEADLRRLHQDPQVMQTLSTDGRAAPPEQTRKLVDRAIAHWEAEGFGPWVFRDHDDEFVGTCGLQRAELGGEPTVELLYALLSTRWGHGLATEMGRAALDASGYPLGLDQIVGYTLPRNLRSQRVLENLGFRESGEVEHAELPHLLYRWPGVDRAVLDPPLPDRVAQVDWTTWRARDVAVLCFLVRGEEILLIEKKRGLGAGKVNGPGGRVEPGETPRQAARRESIEEVGVEPLDLSYRGRNLFQFTDGYSIDVHAFVAHRSNGSPIETDEAVPMWTPIDRIPFDRMWEDDRLWLPRALNGDRFVAHYLFDQDRMIDHELIELPARGGTW